MWLTFETFINYSHRLKSEDWVEESACLVNHTHDHVGIHVDVERLANTPLDFKKIKEIVLMVLNPYIGKNITDEYEIFSTEDFANLLVVNIQRSLGTPKRKIQLHIQEAEKYGVTVDA